MNKPKIIGKQKMNKKQTTLEALEEIAFYESGLSADGCLNNLDEYARKSITRYGRILLKMQKERIVLSFSPFDEK